MGANYYYLVASLPAIALEGSKQLPSYTDFVSEVLEHVKSTDDGAIIQLIRYPFDNFNLITMLEKRDRSFDIRGNYSADELSAAIKNGDGVANYMCSFTEAFKQQKALYIDMSWEDQLYCAFFDFTQLYPNDFIRSWFLFDFNLRNLLAAINLRRNNLTYLRAENQQSRVLAINDFGRALVKSSAPDFGLSAQYPWVEKVISLPWENLIEHQKNIDMLRWSMLDELTTFSYFKIETIAAFCIKLELAHRWKMLDAAMGEQMLASIASDIKSGFKLSNLY